MLPMKKNSQYLEVNCSKLLQHVRQKSWAPVAVFFDVRILAASRFAGIATGVFHCNN